MADRARSPDELEREIELRRQRLARTVDEFATRVNPKTVAQRGTERLREEAGQVARVVGAVMRSDGADDSEANDAPGVDKRLVLVGVGAAVTVTALILWGRRRRRR